MGSLDDKPLVELRLENDCTGAWRKVVVREDIVLHNLHRVIQMCFVWNRVRAAGVCWAGCWLPLLHPSRVCHACIPEPLWNWQASMLGCPRQQHTAVTGQMCAPLFCQTHIHIHCSPALHTTQNAGTRCDNREAEVCLHLPLSQAGRAERHRSG